MHECYSIEGSRPSMATDWEQMGSNPKLIKLYQVSALSLWDKPMSVCEQVTVKGLIA